MSIVPELIETAVVIGEKFATKEAAAAAAAGALKLGEEFLATAKASGTAAAIEKTAGEVLGSNGPKLWPNEVATLRALSLKFEDSPQAQVRLAQLPADFHRSTSYFLQDSSPERIDFVRRELTGFTPDEVLRRPARLTSMFNLEGQLTPGAIQHIRSLELDTPHLPINVETAARTPAGRELVERLAASGSPGSYFDSQRVAAQVALEARFGAASPTVDTLLKLESSAGLKLTRAAAIPDNNYLAALVHGGRTDIINQLGAHESNFPKLAGALGQDSAAITRAGELTTAGELKVAKLHSFIGDDPERAAVVAGELKKGQTAARLNERDWLPGLHLITRSLASDQATLEAVVRYGETDRLGLWRIGSYLDGAPAQRAEVVRELARKGELHDPQGIMRLTMFPEDAATNIAGAAAKGGYKVAKVVEHARDFESGARFVALTRDYLRSGGKLSAEDLEKLATGARGSSELEPAFVKREASLARAQTRITGSMPYAMSNLASDLKSTTDIVLGRFSPGRTLVILGRDMNPFTSLLRANGRNTINFPFSRSQIGNISTARQWMAEVPPNSVVIDSKLNGTVHDAIKAIDPTAEPYLLQSKSPYPALLTQWPLNKLADWIEVFPKITGRCTGFTSCGNAISRIKSTDTEDVARPGIHAIDANRALLQELNMSDWYVWRYKSFTGLSQSERLGLTQPASIQAHLRAVAGARR
jgi:hypothetical protein